MKALTSLAILAAAAPAFGHTIPLASTVEGDSFISEFAGTGVFAQVDLGIGTLGRVGARSLDTDGLFLTDQTTGELPPPGSNPPFTFPTDIFPREENFRVGDITVDTGGLDSSGTGTVPIQSIDLGELWTSDPNRTNSDVSSAPTVVSDISDWGLGIWFFNGAGNLAFGAPDSSDTATFNNGVLTSLDIALDFSFTALGETFMEPDGFSISGDAFSLSLDDAIDFGFPLNNGLARLQVDIDGTVESVGTFDINAPPPVDDPLLNFVEGEDIPGVVDLVLERDFQDDLVFEDVPDPGVILELGFGENTFTGSAADVDGADADTVLLILPEGAMIESFVLSDYQVAGNNGGTGFTVFDSDEELLGDGSFAADATGTPALPFIPAGYSEPTLTFKTIEGVPFNQWTFTITVVPEPAAASLLAIAALAIGGLRRRSASAPR